MDLRTRYTALVTFTTQHVKYISDALRRLEEEEVGLWLVLLLLLFKMADKVWPESWNILAAYRKR